jgi:hypothetical protein
MQAPGIQEDPNQPPRVLALILPSLCARNACVRPKLWHAWGDTLRRHRDPEPPHSHRPEPTLNHQQVMLPFSNAVIVGSSQT